MLGVLHPPTMGSVRVGFTAINVCRSLSCSGRLPWFEAERAAAVTVVVGVVLHVGLGGGVHRASEDKALGDILLSIDLNLKSLLYI